MEPEIFLKGDKISKDNEHVVDRHINSSLIESKFSLVTILLHSPRIAPIVTKAQVIGNKTTISKANWNFMLKQIFY